MSNESEVIVEADLSEAGMAWGGQVKVGDQTMPLYEFVLMVIERDIDNGGPISRKLDKKYKQNWMSWLFNWIASTGLVELLGMLLRGRNSRPMETKPVGQDRDAPPRGNANAYGELPMKR